MTTATDTQRKFRKRKNPNIITKKLKNNTKSQTEKQQLCRNLNQHLKMTRNRNRENNDLRWLWPPTHKANAEDAGTKTYLQTYGHLNMT